MNRHNTQKPQLPAENSVSKRIIAGARRHFFAYGLRSVTMDDLAEELGMSKKTLYVYFPSKAALVEAVVLDKLHEVEADLDQIIADRSSDSLDALQHLLAAMQRHLEEIRPPYVRDVRREAPKIFELVEHRRRDMIQRHFGKLFGEGRTEGILRKDIPAELVIEMLLAAVQAIINPEKLADLGLAPKDGFSAIITVILEGVITETGRSKL
jgi:AcrR family transcriptional regulator